MTYFFSPTTVMLCGLLALPLLAQAQICVQNNLPSNPTAVYTVHGDGTVTDRRTGLMWAQCLAGQSGTQCATGVPIPMDWAAALAYAQSQTLAGHHDWRLPSAKELRTLVEHCRTQPAINEDVFPAQTFDPIAEKGVWTATPDVRDASQAWFIDFETGVQGKALRSTADRHTVRLVRGGLSLLPQWGGVALSGSPTAHSATIVGTSNQSGRGYFLVVRRGSAAPAPAQVKDPAGQGYAPALEISGFKAIAANTPASFGVLVSETQTDYDFYLVAESSAGVLGNEVVKVEFRTAAPASVDGSCGGAHGGTALLTSAPASNLCSAGTASSVTGATSTWTWSCASTNGGANAACQAPRGYTVTPSAGAGGATTPATAQTVAYQATPSFHVTAHSGYTLASVGGSCGGNLSGTVFTTAPVGQDCTVQAVFNVAPPPPPPDPINGACGSSHGQTLAVAPQTNLCVRGTPSSVSGSGPWSWSCSGQYGGRSASCSASISTYLVMATAGEGGRISPPQRSVDHGKSTSFSVQADSGYRLASVSGCNGSLTGTRYFIASVTGACRVQATFTNAPTPTQGPVLDEDFVRQQYLDFLHRAADGPGLAYWHEQLRSGQIRRAELVQRFVASTEFQGRIAPIGRLYFAYFGRVPDYAGLQFWINTMYPQGTPSGLDLHSVSQGFAASVEFERTYGTLADPDFVQLVYRNVLDREPDSAGQAHWLDQLQNGLSRGSMMAQFSESAEYQDFTQDANQVVMAYVGLLRRSPEAAGFEHWLNYLEQGGSFIQLIDGFLRAPEYNLRFAGP